MNSFNHYSFGSVGEWMYGVVAGIGLDPERSGYKHIIIRPRPGGGLTFARGEYQSVRGRIVSDWRLEGNRLSLKVVIPANTSATVYLPNVTDRAKVLESGVRAEQARGVKFLRMEGDTAVYSIASGRYEFVSN